MAKFERFSVVPYALIDVIHALHCNGVTQIGITKSDDDLIVFYDHDQIYKKEYSKDCEHSSTALIKDVEEDYVSGNPPINNNIPSSTTSYNYKEPVVDNSWTKPKFPG